MATALAAAIHLRRIWQLAAGAAWFLLVMAPMYAGVALVAHRIIAHRVAPLEPPAYADLWRGFRQLWLRAVLLALAELAGWGLLAGNLAFYLTRGGFGFLLAAALFVYLLAFWFVNVMYHWPLLVAAEEGLIPVEECHGQARRARVLAALRNSLILSLGGPLPGFGIGAFLGLTGAALAASGIGLVFVLPGYTAVLAAQAAWDQLVRMGVVEPPPDPDAPVDDPGMQV